MTNARIAASDQDHVYAIGIGSNRPFSRALGPRAMVKAAFVALGAAPLRLLASSPIIATRPLGPSMRTYANAAALVVSPLPPPEMLDLLQSLERRFGRRRYRRWGARTLDLDILLWSGGSVRSTRLTVPHAALHLREFALTPLMAVAPDWRVPMRGGTTAQLAARLDKPRPVSR